MEITILQWNIWYKEPISHIVELLKQYNPDIICLQETTHFYPGQEATNTIRHISEKLGYNYAEKTIAIEGEDWLQGNGILSRFPILAQQSHWINRPIGSVQDYDNEHRAYIEAKLRIDAHRELTVATTHMSYTDGLKETERKCTETDELLEFIKLHSKNYIFTGDLNAPPNSYSIKKIGSYLNNAGPDFSQATWTTKPFSHNGFIASTLDWRLDYIFTSKDLSVQISEILPTNYSDHLPIYARIVL